MEKIYHFIAIGGVGMSGLAKYLLEDGHTVSGSDIAESKYIDKLRKLGAEVSIGHSADNVPEDAVVIVLELLDVSAQVYVALPSASIV